MKKIAIDINDTLRDNLAQFIVCYKKAINPDCDIKVSDVKSFDLCDVFEFENRADFNNFRYNDYAYELYARAEPMDKMLPYRFSDWLQNTMRDFDEEDIPEIFLFSPFEIGLTIQATYAFLSKIGCRCREMLFPVDSHKVWDRCDIMITANPKLLSNVPEGKVAIKIKTPYNEDVECEYTFDSLMDLFQDENETISKLISFEYDK